MALKKSELYSHLWSSCDELRGGMDASQYKDYVLVLLFIKYVSDKYAGVPYAPITIPPGASFKDMVALKGKPDIGDQINKKIIGPLAIANKLSDMPDFNEPGKLGSGKEMVERLTNLIAIFESRSLDFSKNRAEGDDILGDAYEYLMRHFATESGKSKGQFYTPAEVSRVIAQKVRISAPKRMKLDHIRVFAISKLGWIKQQQRKLRDQERETPREYLDRESHYVWGRRYLLKVVKEVGSSSVQLKHKEMIPRIATTLKEGAHRAAVAEWYRDQIRTAAAQMIEEWEPIIQVRVKRVFVRRMKTKWGSCNPVACSVRLNTDLAKKPRECLEYIVVHEMVHLLEPTHCPRFISLMDRFMPHWRARRDQLNRLPVCHEEWTY